MCHLHTGCVCSVTAFNPGSWANCLPFLQSATLSGNQLRQVNLKMLQIMREDSTKNSWFVKTLVEAECLVRPMVAHRLQQMKQTWARWKPLWVNPQESWDLGQGTHHEALAFIVFLFKLWKIKKRTSKQNCNTI